MSFKKIVTFEQIKPEPTEENDIFKDMHESIAYVQTTYCHPWPSEFYDNIDWKIRDDKLYVEIHFNFNSEQSYNDWYEIYGEITEELYLEIIEDYKPYGIKIERFFDNVEASKCFDAQPLENFVSKIS